MDDSYDIQMEAKSFLPYRMGYLTEWMIEKAKEELNETDENRIQAIAELKRLIAKKKTIDVPNDDLYLLQFLRARKFHPVRAMEVIKNLYALFEEFSDIYPKNLDLEQVKHLMDTGSGSVLPYRLKDGGAIFFLKPANWDPDKISSKIGISAITGMLLSIAVDPATQVCGVHFIYDATLNWKHFKVTTRRYLELYSKILRNTLPIRINAVHVVNESTIFRYLFNILRMFLSNKITKRFHFHGSDMEHLHKYIPKECLPPDYGGDNISYSASDFCKKEMLPFLERYSEMFYKS
ncbi:alpha-tocopherol transfer protein-like [Parasteatoda tepidariorum]|uniref:alpha-tocopherol transfer protein-like n=1 Tax=Parasteatoda tepidariorum TaxID=114398 RepID=UPI001C72156A|nr:alpha-tocopherol transfer protein-like [Parasteatoda tepidariorum]